MRNVNHHKAFCISDHAGVMHTSADHTVYHNRRQNRNVCNREELDKVTVERWEGIAGLFHDVLFAPACVENLPYGIQQLHISMIEPSVLICKRSNVTLKHKWTTMK